ncbi:NAD(P)H-hydrate dehydratase [Jannaschia sp. 2305UL9-9]|uniref:NAD(P)H-hydrate dehydratase n=1 Tax=Jannaschia sp. 2305UL9-9 TaxID=3121638 RepID=UPI003527F9C4
MTETPRINVPDLWGDRLPRPTTEGHKYDRGHAVLLGAPELTGATRLAAGACSRIGCGLVTVLARARGDVYRMTLAPDIMVTDAVPDSGDVLLGGPGGIAPEDLSGMLAARDMRARVFDAGAIPGPDGFDDLDDTCILTPHTGEFARRFGSAGQGAAQRVAADSGAVVVLKSARTVIAGPDGRLVVNEHASPYLAKAGTGDVLAGLIAGLAGQGMAPFDAACAAVWIHGEAGRRIGPGLIAGDIADRVPAILGDLL